MDYLGAQRHCEVPVGGGARVQSQRSAVRVKAEVGAMQLRAVKMGEGAASQGMRVASGSWKR